MADASTQGLVAITLQKQQVGTYRPIVYGSQALADTESRHYLSHGPVSTFINMFYPAFTIIIDQKPRIQQ